MPGTSVLTLPWPAVSAINIQHTTEDVARIARVADYLVSETEARHVSSWMEFIGEGPVACGWVPGPTLFLEDHRAIELTREQAARGFEYRSFGLASANDLVLVSRERDRVFEHYLADTLGYGRPEVLQVALDSSTSGSLAHGCLYDSEAMSRLVTTARDSNGLNIMPFFSNGHVWRLARCIAEKANVAVRVAAPIPPLSRMANDKNWFMHAASSLLGKQAVPPAAQAYGAAAAAAQLATFARNHGQVVLKTPSSAGAMGNLVFDAASLRQQSLGEIRARILDSLQSIGWYGPWPVLVGVWEQPVCSSPSAQLWIPVADQSPPILEGIFEQRFVGEHGVFAGAVHAELSPHNIERIAREALELARLFQALGYVGRLSLDALLVGNHIETSMLHWIECNARWGGVSIPMTVARRLGIQGSNRRWLVAHASIQRTVARIEEVLGATKQLLFDAERQHGIVWLTPPGEGRDQLMFLAVATITAEAAALAGEATLALSALS